jgi:outer membrane protein assembly factor BamE (lipoprotein component of BamABCDE complex)
MKAISVLIFSGIFLFAGLSVFANTNSMQQKAQQPIQYWIGKPATQLVKALGRPSYTSYTKHDRLAYDYVQEPQHVGPIPTYQFVIGHSGKVTSASVSF